VRWFSNCKPYCMFFALLFLSGAVLPALGQSSGQRMSNVCDIQSSLRNVERLAKEHQGAQARLLLQSIEKCPHLSPIETFNIGWAYGKLHDFPTALKIFSAVSADVPDPMTHAYAIALGQFEMGDYQSAVTTLKTLDQRVPLNADCANLLAVAYAKLGQYQDAYLTLQNQLQKHPHDLSTYLNLITLLTDVGQFAEAEKVASQCVALFPQNSEVFIVRGATETLLGKLSEARGDFESAVKLAPQKADPRFFLALADYKLDNYAAASADLRSTMRAGVIDADLEYLLAECMLKLDPTKPAEAIAELDKAIQLNGNSVPARTLRGKLLLEEGNPQKAAEDLEIAHRIDPTMRSTNYNLARAYFALGRRDEAQAIYQELQQQTTDTVTEISDRRLRQVLSGGP
jgi:tetratricopeptide (TPR) repeat protein